MSAILVVPAGHKKGLSTSTDTINHEATFGRFKLILEENFIAQVLDGSLDCAMVEMVPNLITIVADFHRTFATTRIQQAFGVLEKCLTQLVRFWVRGFDLDNEICRSIFRDLLSFGYELRKEILEGM